jgi:hypothetical protein
LIDQDQDGIKIIWEIVLLKEGKAKSKMGRRREE